MQNDFWQKIEAYLREHKKRKRTYIILSALSVLMAVSVYAGLCLPAISMTKDEPRLEAEIVRATFGDELTFNVSAEAVQGDDKSVFVLNTESNGAGISDAYEFDESVCLIYTDQGKELELHREIKDRGIITYWFSLEPGETASFTLECRSGLFDFSEEAPDREYETASASSAKRASASSADKASASDAEEIITETVNQYLRVYAGMGKKYSSALRAAKTKDNSLELIWSASDQETVWTAVTESGIKVTMTGMADSFPQGDLRLVVREVTAVATPSQADMLVIEASQFDASVASPSNGSVATPSQASKSAVRALDKKVREKGIEASSEWLFDICLMDGNKEVEPLGPVTVTFEGMTDGEEDIRPVIYHFNDEDEEVRDVDAWTDEDGNVVMQTDHFSLYKVMLAKAVEAPVLEDIVHGFGISNQFAIFANSLEARGHMEGSIAVQNVNLASGDFHFGNTPSVGQQHGPINSTIVRVYKKEDGAETGRSYHIGIFRGDTNAMVDSGDIAGGEYFDSESLPAGTYYVRELDDDGKPLEEGEGDGSFTVSYDIVNSGGVIGSLNNGSYIERFVPGGARDFKADGVDKLYVGEENTTNQRSITSQDGNYTVQAQNYDFNKNPISQPVGIDWDAEFERLSEFSVKMGALEQNYNKNDSSPGVKVLNITVPSNGMISKPLIAAAIGENDQNLNQGIPLKPNQYLIVNLDCSNVDANTTVTLPDVAANSNNAAGWKPEYCRQIWNITDGSGCYDGTVQMQNAAAGTILAPRATVNQSATFGGSIIADHVIRSSNEIHQHSFRLNNYISTTVTNTYKEAAGIPLEIIKKNQEGHALEGAEFELYAANENWEPVGTPIGGAPVTTDRTGKVTFTNLFPGGYLLYETKAPDGFIKPANPWKIQVTNTGIVFLENPADVQANQGQNSFSITNQEKKDFITVRVNKQWAGEVDGSGRPGSVTIYLLANGSRMEGDQYTVQLSDRNQWEHTWNQLPQTDSDGNEIVYSIEEVEVDGYKTTITQSQEAGGKAELKQVDRFTDGKTYVLVSGNRALRHPREDSSRLDMANVDVTSGEIPAKNTLWKADSSSAGGMELTSVQNENRRLGYFTGNGYDKKIYALTSEFIGRASWNFYYQNEYIFTRYKGENYYLTANAETATYTPPKRAKYKLYEVTEENAMTLSFTVTNTKEGNITENPEFDLEHNKTIDAFRDGQDNPDTTLDNMPGDKTDLYRLYMDVRGDRYSKPVDMLLIIDNSGSMVQPDKEIDGKTRLNLLNGVLKEEGGFIDSFLGSNPENRIATIYFSGPETQINNDDKSSRLPLFPATVPTTYRVRYGDKYYDKYYDYPYYGDAWIGLNWSNNKTAVKNSLIYTSPNGRKQTSHEDSQAGTNYAAGLQKALPILEASDENHIRQIIFLSDGVPTYYLKGQNGDADLRGTTRGGTGAYNQVSQCVEPTRTAINQFIESCEFPISTIGFGSDNDPNSEDKRTDLLKALASKGGSYHDATNTEELRKALGEMTFFNITNVSITDRISKYVEWYGEQPDVLVTMKDDTGSTVNLWQGTGSMESGKVGNALPGNKATQDGKQIDIINSVIYTPTPGEDASSGTVTVNFNPDYKLEEGKTYTLSFNVKTTQTAYEEYASNLQTGNGYGESQGDPGTDFGANGWMNETSSEKPGFHSNHEADVNYVLDDKSYKAPYDHPVVQVAACGLKLRKTDVSDGNKRLQGAEFDLYRPAKAGEAGTAVPGLEGTYIKVNQQALVTAADGEIKVAGLTPGTYYLVETKAPDGYLLLKNPIQFKLSQNGVDIIGNGADQGMVEAERPGTDGIPGLVIKNSNGFEMPHTGGAGTHPYALIGLLLMGAAAVLLFHKKVLRYG